MGGVAHESPDACGTKVGPAVGRAEAVAEEAMASLVEARHSELNNCDRSLTEAFSSRSRRLED